MPRNPYQYLGTSGYGGNAMGGNYSYGQQGQNNPMPSSYGGPGQQQSYGSQYQPNQYAQDWNSYISQQGPIPQGLRNYPNQGMGPGAAGRMPSPGGRFPGSSNQYLSPTQGGKGTGGGGFGPGVGMAGRFPTQSNRMEHMDYQAEQSRGAWERQMDFHQRLLQQRQMEQALGAQPGWSWYEPFTRPQMASMPYAQPGAGAQRTPGSIGPYGDRGY